MFPLLHDEKLNSHIGSRVAFEHVIAIMELNIVSGVFERWKWLIFPDLFIAAQEEAFHEQGIQHEGNAAGMAVNSIIGTAWTGR